jgi:hypothetical protein
VGDVGGAAVGQVKQKRCRGIGGGRRGRRVEHVLSCYPLAFPDVLEKQVTCNSKEFVAYSTMDQGVPLLPS